MAKCLCRSVILGDSMDFKISSVKIECIERSVLIPFSDDITFFYGNTGVGKTTLFNLINYVLGQELIRTQTIYEEVKGVCIDAFVCGQRLQIERKISSNMITVKDERDVFSFLAKGDSTSRVTFSDYLYKLAGLKPIEMLRGKSSKAVRVSFANFMWFAYLRQDELDNTLFYLGEQNGNFKKYASNYVMRVFLNESKEIEKEIVQEINKITEKQEATQVKLSIIKEIFATSAIFEVDIRNEIKRKYSMLGEINQGIEKILAKEWHNDAELQNELIDKAKIYGKYEAEIRYLNEFKKIGSIKEKYIMLIEECMQKKKEFQNRLSNIYNEPFRKSVNRLEELFKYSLLDVGFPEFSKDDIVKIDSSSFLPAIYNSIEEFRFDYYNLSSSGIRTIFKICYALSIYQFVNENKIKSLLPSFILIDTPMKNISERIDKNIYANLYDYFYRLFSEGGSLYGVQLIVIDKEAPKIFEKNKVTCRMFTNESPLIPLG